MREMMTSGPPWDEPFPEHYGLMNGAASGLPAASLPGPLLGRILRIALAVLLAGSAILLAG
jgi:hypothetical protein